MTSTNKKIKTTSAEEKRSKKWIRSKIELFKKRFLNRTDVLAGDRPAQKRSCPVKVNDIDSLLAAHLLGNETDVPFFKTTDGEKSWTERMKPRFGTYMPGPDGKTKVGCIDIDGDAKKSSPVADPDVAVTAIANAFDQNQVSYLIEKSRSGNGWHIWIFFDEPIDARIVRRFLHSITPQNIPLRGDGFADPKAGRGVEIFPKSDKIRTGGVGSQVFLPLHWSAKNGGNEFHEFCEGSLRPTEIEDVECLSKNRLNELLFNLDLQKPLKESKDAESFICDSVWTMWRKEVLSKIDLAKIYGDRLTGKVRGSGWLECRDPNSKSGDKHPSASVNDKDERCERGRFHSFITGESCSVFDYLVEFGDAKNFRHACSLISEMGGVPLPKKMQQSNGLPEIITSGKQQRDVIASAWEALHIENEVSPKLYRRGDVLVEPVTNDAGGGTLNEVTQDKMFSRIIRSADILREDKDGNLKDAKLPPWVPKDMVTMPDDRLPALNTITGSPYYDRTGRLVIVAGYDSESETYLHYPKDFKPIKNVEPVSSDFAREKIDWLLEEVFHDFPFASPSDRIHVLATLLTPFIRGMITGPVPLLLVSAPTPGAGKTLIGKIIGLVIVGDLVPVQVLSGNEEERRKMIFSELILARPITILDNLSDDLEPGGSRRKADKLNSSSLASVLTSTEITDRLLSTNRKVTVKNLGQWIMTANNPSMSDELNRRSVLVRLEPLEERPWERREFRHKDILEWVRQNRTEMLEVILTAIKSWIDAGRPKCPGKTMGSYESWSNTMRSLLGFLGFSDFLGNQDKINYAVNPTREILNELTKLWLEKFGTKRIATEQVLQLDKDGLLSPLIGQYETDFSKKISLGKLLSGEDGRIYHGHRLVRFENEKTGNNYALTPISQKSHGESGGIRGDKSATANGNGKKVQHER